MVLKQRFKHLSKATFLLASKRYLARFCEEPRSELNFSRVHQFTWPFSHVGHLSCSR